MPESLIEVNPHQQQFQELAARLLTASNRPELTVYETVELTNALIEPFLALTRQLHSEYISLSEEVF